MLADPMLFRYDTEFYSSPKMEAHIESLLTECRKQSRKEALLEAARAVKYEMGQKPSYEILRRMAEGEKDE